MHMDGHGNAEKTRTGTSAAKIRWHRKTPEHQVSGRRKKVTFNEQTDAVYEAVRVTGFFLIEIALYNIKIEISHQAGEYRGRKFQPVALLFGSLNFYHS